MIPLRVEGLHHRWPGGFSLRVDALTLPAGGRLAIGGPSGAGKSTLLGLIAGLWPADGGSVQVAGNELVGASDAARRAVRVRHVGQVFQDFPLVDALTVRENVVLPYRIHPALRLDRAVWDRADGLLDRLGLAPLSGRRPTALSQGERQRVAIARAVVTGPALVLADEPTAGLDAARGMEVIDLLFRLADAGAALVVVTHDPAVRNRFERQLPLGESGAR